MKVDPGLTILKLNVQLEVHVVYFLDGIHFYCHVEIVMVIDRSVSVDFNRDCTLGVS